MKSIKVIIKACFITTILFVYGCDTLVRDYELDVDADLLRDKGLLQYIEEGNDTTLTIFYNAVKHAEIETLFSQGKQTRIVPTNSAMRNMLNSIGASEITDLSPNVLKNLLKYLIVSKEFKSLTIVPDVVNGFLTLSGDSLFVKRNSQLSDPYRMVINSEGGFNPSSVQIMKQDYVFKDGIAQVVDVFPIFKRNVLQPDPEPEGVDYSLAMKDTIWISEDASVYAGGKTKNYGTAVLSVVPRSGQYRYSFVKFDRKPISFVDDLVSAKLNLNVKKIAGAFVPLLGVYEVLADWEENTIVFNTMPSMGAQVTSATLELGWNALDVTASIKRLYEDEQQTAAYGFSLLNGRDVPSSTLEINQKESNDKPNISLMSALTSELHLNVSLPVTIHATDEIAYLLKDNLSLSGESFLYDYTDNNIMFVLITPPENGTLTYYGLPMRKNDRFTQHDLAIGVIKYIGDNAPVNDVFELKVQDYISGVYPELISILVR